MNDTVIYLIRHAETVEENGIRNTNVNWKVKYNSVKVNAILPCF